MYLCEKKIFCCRNRKPCSDWNSAMTPAAAVCGSPDSCQRSYSPAINSAVWASQYWGGHHGVAHSKVETGGKCDRAQSPAPTWPPSCGNQRSYGCVWRRQWGNRGRIARLQHRWDFPFPLLVPAPQIWNPIWRLEGFVLVSPHPLFSVALKCQKIAYIYYLPFVTSSLGKFWWSGNSIVWSDLLCQLQIFFWKNMYVRHTGFSLVFRVGYLISYKIIMIITTVICTKIVINCPRMQNDGFSKLIFVFLKFVGYLVLPLVFRNRIGVVESSVADSWQCSVDPVPRIRQWLTDPDLESCYFLSDLPDGNKNLRILWIRIRNTVERKM